MAHPLPVSGYDSSADFSDRLGVAELSERKPTERADIWDVETLTRREGHKVSVGFSTEEGVSVIVVRLSAYHVPNEAGDRAFHSHLEAELSLEDAATLRRYLGFVLGIGQ